MRFAILTLWLSCALTAAASAQDDTATAIFAGGCFWCMEPPFDKLEGVQKTTSGYVGGHLENPTYQQVTGGGTGHYEAVQIRYNPAQVSYQKLLDVYWRNIDPFDVKGQFCDRGPSYRPAVFAVNEQQAQQARASKKALHQSGPLEQPVLVPVLKAKTFYPAEDYHQNYYTKNPIRYKFYRYRCGRDARLEEVWGE